MPDRTVVSAFVALVESGKYIEALQRFYHPDAVVWENQQAPRVGLDALLENEERVLKAFDSVTGRAMAVLVDGDQVAIHWRFDFVRGAAHVSLIEMAFQQWADGKIACERFYYDPAQLRPAAGAAAAEGEAPQVARA